MPHEYQRDFCSGSANAIAGDSRFDPEISFDLGNDQLEMKNEQ
jgi:hypothetical protein